MIYKSFLVEQNLGILKNNLILFYGENYGLINLFKYKIAQKFKGSQMVKFDQDEIVNNSNNFFNEINNRSMFDNFKVIFITNSNDKLLKIIKQVLPVENDNKFFLFGNILDKRSNLRKFFETNETTDVIPCYQDTEVTIKKLILNELKGYVGITTEIINYIYETCGNDRGKLHNEIDKIRVFFDRKKLNEKDLSKLLNIRENNDFNEIQNYAVSGNKEKTNKLLDSSNVNVEQLFFYLANINQRFLKLKWVKEQNIHIEKAVNELKPPIFWKDKPIFIHQAKKWNLKKIEIALNRIYEIEIKIKTNSIINKKIIFKKLLVDICNIANAV